ncbi:class I SAM-dependent methyltransferase [Pseudidiomarina woesei]|uniref:Ribosomal RNA small subunit methyltransferase J n=1 Tax=Pseudidiomarina woesei TaxID=1381080 RepID=A0A0K6H5F5_9GAMM|nr:class I SAM-dependent methyltransferase [Pseudidiomarina woesei]CUA86116.1 Putative SAM-dependent methyltransferase [Pseudidiomarina woesei]
MSDTGFVLEQSDDGLQLRWLAQPKMLPLRIDFLAGKNAFRAAHARIKDEAIARACALHKLKTPSILDATAGLGRDALVLAQLGAHVGLNERHPIVRQLLQDALQRLHAAMPDWQQRLYFVDTSELAALADDSFDVVYLDPMYPKGDRKAKAAVKKDMQMFQQLVGSDEDADALLEPALRIARQRVVVKRPQHADFLAGVKPHAQVISKKHRFDLYFPEQQND